MKRLLRWLKCKAGSHEACMFTGRWYVCTHCRKLFR